MWVGYLTEESRLLRLDISPSVLLKEIELCLVSFPISQAEMDKDRSIIVGGARGMFLIEHDNI